MTRLVLPLDQLPWRIPSPDHDTGLRCHVRVTRVKEDHGWHHAVWFITPTVIQRVVFADDQCPLRVHLPTARRPMFRAIAISADSHQLAFVLVNGTVGLFEAPTGEARSSRRRSPSSAEPLRTAYVPWTQRLLMQEREATCVQFAENDSAVIVCDAKGVHRFDLAANKASPLTSNQAVFASDRYYVDDCGHVHRYTSEPSSHTLPKPFWLLDHSQGQTLWVSGSQVTWLDADANVVSQHKVTGVTSGSIAAGLVYTGSGAFNISDLLPAPIGQVVVDGLRISMQDDGIVLEGDLHTFSGECTELSALRRDVLAGENATHPYHPLLHNGSTFVRAALEIVLLQGSRYIKLTDTSLQALWLIARAGPGGIIQGDLCKALEADTKTTFHHLKSLNASSLIRKQAVLANGVYTHKFTWYQHGDVDDADTGENVRISDLIVRSLSTDVGITMTDLKAKLNLAKERTKSFQRAIRDLRDRGAIVVDGSMVRLAAVTPQKGSPKKGHALSSSSTTSTPTSSISNAQLFDFIRSFGPVGATSKDICERFGVDFKRLHRITERLFTDSDYKDRVSKQLEFVGRERRNRYIATDVDDGEDGKVTATKKESVSMQDRKDALLRLLNQRGIVEVDRALSLDLGHELSTSHMIDTRTIKRIISSLEEEGRLKFTQVKIVGSGQAGQRVFDKTLLLALDKTDADVAEYVREKRERLARQAVEDASSSDEEEPTASEELIQVDKFALGFKMGSYVRARLLCSFLLHVSPPSRGHIADLKTLLYEQLTVGLYASVVGFEQCTQPVLDDILLGEGKQTARDHNLMRGPTVRNILVRLVEIMEQEAKVIERVDPEDRGRLPTAMQWLVSTREEGEAAWQRFRDASYRAHPNRWLERPIPASQRRRLLKEQRQGSLDGEDDSVALQDVGDLDDALPRQRTKRLAPLSDLVPSDDRLLMAAFLVGYYQSSPNATSTGRGLIPYQLICEALCATFHSEPLSERQTSQALGELRRRLKIFGSNQERLLELTMMEWRALAILNLGPIVGQPPVVESMTEAERFRARVLHLLQLVDNWDTQVMSPLRSHHLQRLSTPIDPSRLRRLYSLPDTFDTPLHRMIEPESGKTRNELVHAFYQSALYGSAQDTPSTHPPCFERLQACLLRGEGDAKANADGVMYAVDKGYLAADRKGPLMLNERTYCLGVPVFDYDSFVDDVEAVVSGPGDSLPLSRLDDAFGDVHAVEGVLVGLAVGDFAVANIDSADVMDEPCVVRASGPIKDRATYAFLTGRHRLLSEHDRRSILASLLH